MVFLPLDMEGGLSININQQDLFLQQAINLKSNCSEKYQPTFSQRAAVREAFRNKLLLLGIRDLKCLTPSVSASNSDACLGSN